MIGTILNQIRQARALELRELTADALAEAQLQTQAETVEAEHRPPRAPSQTHRRYRRQPFEHQATKPSNARLERKPAIAVLPSSMH